jgi:hypothetical protein
MGANIVALGLGAGACTSADLKSCVLEHALKSVMTAAALKIDKRFMAMSFKFKLQKKWPIFASHLGDFTLKTKFVNFISYSS